MGPRSTARKGNSRGISGEGRQNRTASDQQWITIEEIAARYQLSIRKIFYLVAEGVLPAFKVGHALRFDPAECDLAMRAFRRASQFDDFIEESRAVMPARTGACSDASAESAMEGPNPAATGSEPGEASRGQSQVASRRRRRPSKNSSLASDRNDQPARDYAKLSQLAKAKHRSTLIKSGQRRASRRSRRKSWKSCLLGLPNNRLCPPRSGPAVQYSQYSRGFCSSALPIASIAPNYLSPPPMTPKSPITAGDLSHYLLIFCRSGRVGQWAHAKDN
jgi:hypothetical protein